MTIVVPVHNGQRYLSQALDSIAAQTFPDWEAVIVDDCSSDGSLALAQEFEQRDPERVQVLPLSRNLGVGGARNAGLEVARAGRLVMLLDQDDYLLEHYLETAVALFDAAVDRGERPGIFSSNGLVETDDGIAGEWGERFWWKDELDLDSMLRRNYIVARCMFSRPAFNEVGGFDPTCLTADDYDLWLRLMEAGYSVVRTREPLFVYRIHGASQSQDQRRLSEGSLATYRRALERGALNPAQRRVVKQRIRHYRAVRDRALIRQAVAGRRWGKAAALAVSGAPSALLAMAEHPRWWQATPEA